MYQLSTVLSDVELYVATMLKFSDETKTSIQMLAWAKHTQQTDLKRKVHIQINIARFHATQRKYLDRSSSEQRSLSRRRPLSETPGGDPCQRPLTDETRRGEAFDPRLRVPSSAEALVSWNAGRLCLFCSIFSEKNPNFPPFLNPNVVVSGPGIRASQSRNERTYVIFTNFGLNRV